MKVLFTMMAMLLTASAYAQDFKPKPFSWISGELIADSLVDKQQVLTLQRLVIEEIRSQRSDEESFLILNAKLKEMGLPVVQENAAIELIYGNGFAGSIEGATISDQSHLYCLPCKLGWNEYEIGVKSLSKDNVKGVL
jgi:hypothetical protein